MFKKSWFNFILVVIGLVLIIYAFYFSVTLAKEQSGVMYGIGSALFGVGIASIILNVNNKRHPATAKWKNIQVNDERNKILRYKANNTVRNINTWLLFILAIITILAKLPLWLTLSLVGINVIDSCLYVYFLTHIAKKCNIRTQILKLLKDYKSHNFFAFAWFIIITKYHLNILKDPFQIEKAIKIPKKVD